VGKSHVLPVDADRRHRPSGRSAWAELPPTAYAEMQQRAGEVLQIEVLGVQGLARRGPNEESHSR
jgi:hypothetical protein